MKNFLVIICLIFICAMLGTSCSKDSQYICKCQYKDIGGTVNYDVHNLPGQYYKNCEEFEESAAGQVYINCEHVH